MFLVISTLFSITSASDVIPVLLAFMNDNVARLFQNWIKVSVVLRYNKSYVVVVRSRRHPRARTHVCIHMHTRIHTQGMHLGCCCFLLLLFLCCFLNCYYYYLFFYILFID